MVDLSSLNEKQHKAVITTDGPVAVISSAGSGKTRTMVKKVEYLLNKKNILPSRIWACTFTNKAADEMRERLNHMVGEKAEKVKLSTLHSLSYQIWKAGVRSKDSSYPMPKILVEHLQGRALAHLYKFLKEKCFPNKDAKGYLAIISNLKLDLIGPEEYKEQNKQLITSDRIVVTGEGYNRKSNISNPEMALYFFYKEYERWKKEYGYIDFQDMLVNCYKLLADPRYKKFKDDLAQRCEYVLVDEAQDTNTVSFKILDFMAEKHRNVTIVGDMRQLIYSFQGARVQNILDFVEKYSPEMIDLDINYRSTQTIVENANAVIKPSKQIIGGPAKTPNKVGEQISYFTSEDQGMESYKVLELIQHLISKGAEYRDIAVLYRVHSQSRMVEDRLIMEDIPYVTFSKTSFYQRKEIKDLLAYLTIFVNPDNVKLSDLKRIMNKPVRYISNKNLEDLEFAAIDEGMTIWEALKNVYTLDLDYKTKENMNRLYLELSLGAKNSKGKTARELCEYVIKDMGYEKWAIEQTKVSEVDSDIELNFDAILDSVSGFSDAKSYLDFVELVKKKEKEKKERMKNSDGDFIKLMTIHSSKGKEFKYVILLGVCDRIYPFHKSAKEEGGYEEERRVMYVAVTRPEEKLYLSVIDGRLGRYKVKPSMYLEDMTIDYNGGQNDYSF